MRRLCRIVQVGLITLALVLLPKEAQEGRIFDSELCAAESDKCQVELGSYCAYGGVPVADRTNKT